MSRIFISYRREDSAGYAGRIYDRLGERFGGDHIFMDIATIEPGLDFVEVIEKAVGSCDVLIALIGRQWLTVTDATGHRRLDASEDFVRLEIATALDRNIRVIPVLVRGATMPRSTDLPEALKKLSRRNALEISDTRFHYDVTRLIETLEMVARVEEGAMPFWQKVPLWAWGTIGGIVLLAVVGGILLIDRGEPTPTPMARRATTPVATVPPTATSVPIVVPTATPYPTDTPIPPTPTSLPPTDTPTPVPPTDTPTVLPTDTPTPKPVAVVQAEALNVRGGPGTEYGVMGQVKQGDKLEIVARTEKGDWLQVRLTDGKEGWVSAQLVEVDGGVVGIPVAVVIPPRPTPSAPSGMVYVPAGEFIMGSTDADVDSALTLCNELPGVGAQPAEKRAVPMLPGCRAWEPGLLKNERFPRHRSPGVGARPAEEERFPCCRVAGRGSPAC